MALGKQFILEGQWIGPREPQNFFDKLRKSKNQRDCMVPLDMSALPMLI